MQYAYQNIFKAENIETFIYSSICFFVPFLLGHPQLLVGVIVNAALVTAALRNAKWLPVVVMPSIGVLSRGLIFGPMTPFLVYMIPFIWISNWLLFFLFRSWKWKAALIAPAAKAVFLFLIALLFFSLHLVPEAFLSTMGIIQFYTAVAGGIIALATNRILNHFSL